jgi:CAAX prenyl protease-like protein
LDDSIPYLALAVYPAIVMFVFDWWGSFRWARKSKSFIYPPEIRKKRETTGRYLFFLKFAVLLLALWCLSAWRTWHRLVAVPVDPRSFLQLIAWGGAAAIMALAFSRVSAMVSPRVAASENASSYLEGPVPLWIGVYLIGGFSEEFWRAFVIASFVQSGHSAAYSNLAAALAFSLAHLSGLPPRILPGEFVRESVVGLIFGGLFIWHGNLISPCCASVLYYTASLLVLRRRYGKPGSN